MSDCNIPDENKIALSVGTSSQSTHSPDNEANLASTDNTATRSSRARRARSAKTESQSMYLTGVFTEIEKENILVALYQHGCNVDKIIPYLPNRSKEQVKDFLTAWYRRVRKIPAIISKKDRISLLQEPIELWLKKLKVGVDYDGTNLPIQWLARAFGYIAKLEKHPTMEETGGINFRKLYQFLETMLRGNASQNLLYEDTYFILSSLRELRKRLNKIDFFKDEMHIKRPLASKPRTYKRVKRNDGTWTRRTKEFEKLLSTTAFNPLALPIDILDVSQRASC